MPSIGLNSCHERAAARRRLLVGGQSDRGLLDLELVDPRQELVQRWVEQAHGDRKPVHRLEDLDEVGLLDDPQLLRAPRPRPRGSGRGSSAARPEGGPRRGTCARCGKGRCPRRRTGGRSPRRGRCRRSHARRACPCGSCRPTRGSRRTRAAARTRSSAAAPRITWPVDPSSEIRSPSCTTMSPTVNAVAVDAQRLGADDRRDAPTAGDDRGVADQAATRGEDALRSRSCRARPRVTSPAGRGSPSHRARPRRRRRRQ